MTTTTEREKVAEKRPKAGRKLADRPKKSSARPEKAVARPADAPAVSKLRTRLGLTQAQFARLLPVSVRSLATLEGGTAPTDSVARRLRELERLTTALSEV